MARSSSLKSDGTLYVDGVLDEVTQNTISESATTLKAREFDEITLSPLTNGLVKRQTQDGRILVAKEFVEIALVRTGLVSYLDVLNYPGSGTNWPDDSGNDNDATLTSPDYQSGPPPYLNFTGSNYGNMGNILNKNAYTKCAMIYLNSYGYNNNIISGDNSDQHAFWFGGGNKLLAGHNGDSGGSWSVVVGATTINLYQWYFVSVTFDGVNGWKLYVNAVEDASSATTTVPIGSDPGKCLIGAYNYGNNFVGRIPLSLVYNRALSSAEISQNYNTVRGRFGI